MSQSSSERPCFVCRSPVECEPGYPLDIKVVCWPCIDTARWCSDCDRYVPKAVEPHRSPTRGWHYADLDARP
jgi:hypothetical protein